MKVGTAEPIEEKKKKKLKKRPGYQRSSGLGNDDGDSGDQDGGSGGNNFGGGGNPPKKDKEAETEEPTNKSRIMMIFLLLVVLMTFGGLIGAYVVLSTNKAAEWKPFANLPYQVWISTIIILTSSITYHFAKSALYKNLFEKAKKWFLATTCFGGLFISSQLLVWLELYNRGLYMRGNPYAGFFYILTAVHAVHVLGGILSLGYIILRTWNKTRSDKELEKRKNDATAIGWYWHTMDGLWLILLFLLGFFK
jgi:cytochrome c oxidase subunit 3